MKPPHQIVVAPITLPARKPHVVMTLGAKVGAEKNIPAFQRLFAELPGEFAPVLYADAVGAHAERVAKKANEAGVPARAVTLSTADLDRLPYEIDTLVVQLDRPEAQLAAFEWAVTRRIPVVMQSVVAPPRGLPLGVMTAHTKDDFDGASADDVRHYLRTLARITSRRGSESVTDGDEAAELRVADIRARFREHLPAVLRKVAANLTPEVPPIVATDGEHVMPLVVVPRERWSSAIELESHVLLDRHDLVIEPGSKLVVAETLATEQPQLRLTNLHFRRSDRRLGSRGSRTLSAADFAPLPPRPARSERERGDSGIVVGFILGLAVLAMAFGGASRTAPMRTTD
jgi:hypothetical protein